jgi:AcrR family transcriptional regulator
VNHQEETLFARSLNLFFTYGIRALTMDEIASRQGISKKTLYQYVSNKRHLVKCAFEYFIKQQKANVEKIHVTNLNAIDELFQIYQQTCKELQGMNSGINFELHKYYPDTWELFQDYKQNFIYQHCRRNLNKGIQEELYRSDFDHHIITTFYVARIDILTDSTYFPMDTYSYNQILEELFKYHIRGIGSKKGIAYLEEKGAINF